MNFVISQFCYTLMLNYYVPVICLSIVIIIPGDFFIPVLADIFSQQSEWLQNPQVSKTLHSIPINLNNAVIWIVRFPTLPASLSGLFQAH